MSDQPKYEAGFGSNALKQPQRVVFLTAKTSAKVKGETGKRLMSFPHLILREFIVLQVLTIALVLVSLMWDAPLEQLANPLVTPNPAKAPWYFLGLQELLHYFPPLVAGILIPTLVIVALVVIPYFKINIKGEPLWASHPRQRFRIFLTTFIVLVALFGLFEAWTVIVPSLIIGGLILVSYFAPSGGGRIMTFLRERPISWWVMTWFITVALVLTVVGTFFRGPGWSWVSPWR
jgi:menaquinol-cytochrome c reductase cytochrome b/c subunit